MSDGLKRREFLKVLGVSGAGAGMVGCSTESVEKLMPYVVPPEEITPGVATWYTSVCGECEAGCGIWVRTREGRVIKVEGNPDHPVSGGALCSRGHSSIQGLYNPDRFTGPMARRNGQLEAISWDEAEQMLADGLGSAGGHLTLSGGLAGPSLMMLMEEFAGRTGGGVVRFDPLADGSATRGEPDRLREERDPLVRHRGGTPSRLVRGRLPRELAFAGKGWACVRPNERRRRAGWQRALRIRRIPLVPDGPERGRMASDPSPAARRWSRSPWPT